MFDSIKTMANIGKNTDNTFALPVTRSIEKNNVFEMNLKIK